MLTKGVSTFTLSPSWRTWVRRATRQAKNPSEATQRIATSTTRPTTIRIALRAPPPEVGAGVEATGGVEGAGGAEPTAAGGATAGAGDGARTAAPHLLQNLVPGTILVPQELQNAIGHLIGRQR